MDVVQRCNSFEVNAILLRLHRSANPARTPRALSEQIIIQLDERAQGPILVPGAESIAEPASCS